VSIQSSSRWNSGSVSKSHAIVAPPIQPPSSMRICKRRWYGLRRDTPNSMRSAMAIDD
jgi:hypothetical protein